MKKAVVFVALGGLLLSSIGLGLQYFIPAFGAELDGFAINTQDKAVTITLYTDQRIPYTTEHQGKQFTIVLPGTQLSPEQVNNGLPVVIDNKNRFIGRAVPTEDGKVKIILPNLPATDYAVSIQQKRPSPAPVGNTPSENIKPRPAVNSAASNNFEQVASNFPKPVKRAKSNPHLASRNNPLRLSPNPGKTTGAPIAGTGSIWNPYVVKAPSVPTIATSPYSNYQPVAKAHNPNHLAAGFDPTSPINTVSVAESMQGNPSGNFVNPNRPLEAKPANDPLWYLHSLPPNGSAAVTPDNLNGPALQTNPAVPLVTQDAKTTEKPVAPNHSWGHSVKEAVAAFPKWLLITLAIFLGGIGTFTTIGGLILLRVLFSQVKQQLMPQGLYGVGMQPFMPTAAPTEKASSPSAGTTPEKSSYASRPENLSQLGFQDKATISSLAYLKDSPGNIAQAVHNAVLVKFPVHKKHRNGIKNSTLPAQKRTSVSTAKP